MDPTRQRLERDERLLACYDKALGHDLSNQLVAVQGLLRLLQAEEGARLGPEGRQYLESLLGAAGRAHRLVGALAQLARLACAPGPAEELALAEAAREAAAQINWLAPGQKIEYQLPHDSVRLRLPRAALHQVLVHLLRNAAQAAASRVEIGARPVAGGVEFWVADNGHGMSPEQQQHLFEPQSHRMGRPDRTGLGLFLVRQLVEGWGGAIRVQSVPGQGSTFSVVVPAP